MVRQGTAGSWDEEGEKMRGRIARLARLAGSRVEAVDLSQAGELAQGSGGH